MLASICQNRDVIIDIKNKNNFYVGKAKPPHNVIFPISTLLIGKKSKRPSRRMLFSQLVHYYSVKEQKDKAATCYFPD